jgi:hypothetical protein
MNDRWPTYIRPMSSALCLKRWFACQCSSPSQNYTCAPISSFIFLTEHSRGLWDGYLLAHYKVGVSKPDRMRRRVCHLMLRSVRANPVYTHAKSLATDSQPPTLAVQPV